MYKLKIKNYRVEGSNDTIDRLEREEVVNLIAKESYSDSEINYAIDEMKIENIISVFDDSSIVLYDENGTAIFRGVVNLDNNGSISLLILKTHLSIPLLQYKDEDIKVQLFNHIKSNINIKTK